MANWATAYVYETHDIPANTLEKELYISPSKEVQAYLLFEETVNACDRRWLTSTTGKKTHPHGVDETLDLHPHSTNLASHGGERWAS